MSAKILVVDDNIVVLKAIQMKLAAVGYQVITAVDGSTAIGIVRREKPDLIVLDISFPPDVSHGGGVGWDGFLIMQWLRRMDEAKTTPIIIITSGDPVKYRDLAISSGASAFFTKPIDNEALVDVIRQNLEKAAEAS